MWFDSLLKWETRIDNIKNTLSKFIVVISRTRNNLNHENIKLIYDSLVYPYLICCPAIWGGAYYTYMNNLFTTQKILIRIMFHGLRYDHINSYFSKHKLVTLPQCINLKTVLFVYIFIRNSPENIDFGLLSGATDTWRPYTLRLPLCRTYHGPEKRVADRRA